MNRPKNVEVTAINITLIMVKNQFILDKSTINEAKITEIKALIVQKIIEPVVFANISGLRLIGARSSNSNERLFFESYGDSKHGGSSKKY